MAHVKFTYGPIEGVTYVLTADGPAFRVVWFLDLYEVGPSVGANLPIADTDGTLARDRDRGELPVELTWEIRGTEDLDGTAATDEYQQLRRNVMDLTRWFDDAPGREFTVTLVETDGTEWEAIAHHEEWGQVDYHGLSIVRRQLLTVADGLLTEVTS